jgi:aryl-alcohol dehydrogenase-like predicted oxidoreductase
MEQGYGTSEEFTGRWLKRTSHRDDIVLATKVYQPMGTGPNDRHLSAYHIKRACEARSTRRGYACSHASRSQTVSGI